MRPRPASATVPRGSFSTFSPSSAATTGSAMVSVGAVGTEGQRTAFRELAEGR